MKKISFAFLLIALIPAFAFAINLNDYRAPSNYVNTWYDYQSGVYETDRKISRSEYYDGVLVDVIEASTGGIVQTRGYETSTHRYGIEMYNQIWPGFGLINLSFHFYPPLGKGPNIIDIGNTIQTKTSLLATGCRPDNPQFCESTTGEVSLSTTVIGFETVSTPLGTFNALKVRSVLTMKLYSPDSIAEVLSTDTAEGIKYLVPGIGSIMEVLEGATSMLVSTNAPLPSDRIRDFVRRFYNVVLGRSAEEAGLNYWVNSLDDGTRAGADVAREFIFSNEFMGKNLGNEAYLDVLYSAFFNREADPRGRNHWLGMLSGGASREDVLNGFIYSQEFADLCQQYSINPVN